MRGNRARESLVHLPAGHVDYCRRQCFPSLPHYRFVFPPLPPPPLSEPIYLFIY